MLRCALKSMRWVVAIAVPLATGPAVRADTPTEARKAIQAAFDRDAAAARRMDLNEFCSNMAPDFVNVDRQGRKVTLAEVRAQLKLVARQMKSLAFRGTIEKFALHGNTATITVREHVTMTAGAATAGKTGRYVLDDTAEETWELQGKRWLRKFSKTLKYSESMPKS